VPLCTPPGCHDPAHGTPARSVAANVKGLEGKVALVTGGSSGLGEAVVLRLAEEGVHLAVGGRDAERTAAVAARRAQAAGRDIATSVALGDVSVVADCERLLHEAVDRHGRLDVLVNSAGVWLEKPILETTEDDWDECIDIALKGT
jgi:NAD(P)-dependent dehydrogenase (short-subunit alcohol dehydrogenase family)